MKLRVMGNVISFEDARRRMKQKKERGEKSTVQKGLSNRMQAKEKLMDAIKALTQASNLLKEKE